MNKNPNVTSCQIIHASLTGGVVLFLCVIFFLSTQSHQGEPLNDLNHLKLFGYIATGMLISGIFISYQIFNTQLKRILDKQDDTPRLNIELTSSHISLYQAGMIIRDAIIEGPALFSCVTLFLIMKAIGNLDLSNPIVLLPLGNIALYIIIMLYWFPTESKIKSDFERVLQNKEI